MTRRELLLWFLAAALVVGGVGLWLWWTAPPDNPLQSVYEVM
jgi:hypothetical protein